MEDNGKGIFYGVIGVATLIVAIIGATFAYFTAAGGSSQEGDITGQTATASSVGVAVTPVYPVTEKTELLTGRMVPLKTADMGTALANECVADGGYIACQVYKITLTSAGADAVYATTRLQLSPGSITMLRWQNLEEVEAPEEGEAAYAVTGDAVETHTGATAVKSQHQFTGEVSYYVVVWVESDDTGAQTNTDAGKVFTGTVTTEITDENGQKLDRLEATFTTGV